MLIEHRAQSGSEGFKVFPGRIANRIPFNLITCNKR